MPADDRELDRALEAMTAPELRAAVRSVLGALDEETRASTIDTLVARAAKSSSGWRPSRPSRRLIEQARSFVEAASHLGYADPADATEYLRGAMKAFMAGDHAGARAVFETILVPIAGVEIDLGQHELVEEVIGVDAHTCVAQYVASVYTTSPLPERATAVLAAIEQAQGVSSLLSPIQEMEEVSAGALPDLSAFLPQWVKRLRRFKPSKDEWESDQERWLREAVFRLDGASGLERLARTTKRPQACLAWCQALTDQGDWTAALRAYETAATLVGPAHWRGRLLDGAALAAQELRRTDLPARLEAAWRVDPTVVRLLRWLVARGDAPATVRATAKKALARCPKKAGRQMGLLCTLVGDVDGAASLLSKASGLGWSDPDHAGHTVFPLLAMLLSKGAIGDALTAELDASARDVRSRRHSRTTSASRPCAHRRPGRSSEPRAPASRSPPQTLTPQSRPRVRRPRSASRGSSVTPGVGTTGTPRCWWHRVSRTRRRDSTPRLRAGQERSANDTGVVTRSGKSWRRRSMLGVREVA